MAQIDDVLNQVERVETRLDARVAPERAQTERASAGVSRAAEGVRAAAADPVQPPPDLKPLPFRPETTYRDTMNAFLNPAVVLSMLGGLLTRAPLTTALSAGAAAMRGYHQGDVDAFKREEKIFEDNFEQALKTNQEELARYRQVLDNHNLSVRDKMAALDAASAEFQNKNMQLQLKEGHFDKALTTVSKMAEMNDRLQQLKIQRATAKDRLDETVRHDKVMEDIARENADTRAAAAGTKASAKTKQAVSDLQGIDESLVQLRDLVAKNPDAVGVKGRGRRLLGSVGGQIDPKFADPIADEVEARIKNLQATMVKPYLQARYFSGPAATRLDQLVRGLGTFDDPVKVIANLDEIERVLQSHIGTIEGVQKDYGMPDEVRDIKADLKAKRITREEAEKKLRDLGYED